MRAACGRLALSPGTIAFVIRHPQASSGTGITFVRERPLTLCARCAGLTAQASLLAAKRQLLSDDHCGIPETRDADRAALRLLPIHEGAHAHPVVAIRAGLRGLDMNVGIGRGEALLHQAGVASVGKRSDLHEE